MAGSSSSFKNPNVATLHHNPASKPSNFLCKFFIIILVLLLVPLIPSQAPDFITQSSIFTKLWELLHLLFIGLAVCYGLFSKRSSNVDLENQSRNDTSSQAYLNGILDVSSYFEDGLENVCGYDERRLILQSSVSGHKHRSLLCENGPCNSSDIGEEKVTKTSNSMYLRGESMVVVATGECVVDEWGKPISKIEHKPLNLPVRSLRSRVKGVNKPEENDALESTLSSEDFSENGAKEEVGKIRGMVPINLEKKFEKVAEFGPIPWRLRSGKMEMREEISKGKPMEMREEISKGKPTSHARPHSVGEFDFQILKSRLIRQPKSSVTSSNSSSVSELSPSRMKMENLERRKDVRGSSGTVVEPGINGEVPIIASNSTKMENLERRKDVRGSSGTVAEPGINGEAPFIASKSSRHLSIGSSNEIRMQRNDKENLMEAGKSTEEQSLGSDKKIWSFFESDLESPRPAKVLSRGKSVRTFRSSKFVLDEVKRKENNSSFVDDHTGKMNNEIQAASFVNDVEGEKLESSQVSADKPIVDSICRTPKPTFSETQSEDKQDLLESSSETSEENSASQSDSLKGRSDEEAESGLEGSEVDRKAGEFIAKFREQIRLQKLASIRRYRG